MMYHHHNYCHDTTKARTWNQRCKYLRFLLSFSGCWVVWYFQNSSGHVFVSVHLGNRSNQKADFIPYASWTSNSIIYIIPSASKSYHFCGRCSRNVVDLLNIPPIILNFFYLQCFNGNQKNLTLLSLYKSVNSILEN